jgi:GAF domain-containing protein
MKAVGRTEGELALDKQLRYTEMLSVIKTITEHEKHPVTNLANITAVIKDCFDFLWTGFYIVDDNELVLGPFQGSPACTRIQYGKGVCGRAWQEQKTIIVADVEQFPGHIVCDSKAKSEIVVPVLNNSIVLMVLDIDSDKLNTFDETDQYYLEKIFEIYSPNPFKITDII